MYKRQYIRNETKIVVKTRKRVYTANTSGPRPPGEMAILLLLLDCHSHKSRTLIDIFS